MTKIKSWTFQQHYTHGWWMDIMTILVFDGHLQTIHIYDFKWFLQPWP
jgi:hypothetical protein